MDINIFTQIGFVVLVGLASKNAILIVEFAKQQREAGRSPPRGDAGGLPAAAAADHDDLVRLHPRRGAAGARRRGRRRDAPHAGHGRLQRHVGRDAVRHLPDARLLLRRSTGWAARGCSHSPADALDRLTAAGRCSRWGSRRRWCGSRRPGAGTRGGEAAAAASRPTTPTIRSEDAPCSPASSSTGRSSPRCCRSSSRWPAAIAVVHAAGRPVSRDHAADGRGLGRLSRAPTPRSWPTRWPRRSSSRSTASRTCSTCRRSAPTTAPTR